MNTYEQILQKLFLKKGVFQTEKLGFYHHFAKKLGNPHFYFPSIHIAGTNGKGSVSLKIAKALEYCGLKVGLFTSPHLYCFTERIQINGRNISKERVERGLKLLFLMEEERMSFFDFTTFLAFQYFQEEKVDIAVVETGIGGQDDPTNIVKPLLSVITSIGFDHTHILGNSLEEIAKQKAGIIKPEVPVVVGPFADLEVIYKVAEENKSPFHVVSSVSEMYDEENQNIAKKALQVLKVKEEAIQEGIKSCFSCRFEKIGRAIFDVAHNPPAIDSLLKALNQERPSQRFNFVIGISNDKDSSEILKRLIPKAAHFYLVKTDHARSSSPSMLSDILKKQGFFQFTIPSSIEEGLDLALNQKEGVVVCGSFYIMRKAREHILRQES